MSRVPLILVPTHPDATGGIGFVSDVQTKFGLAILAFGISNIASTVGYELSIEHAPWSLHTVWGASGLLRHRRPPRLHPAPLHVHEAALPSEEAGARGAVRE